MQINHLENTCISASFR